MNMRIYDLIVVGGGPAGYTAALYGARAGLDVLVLEKLSVGGQVALTHMIDNYPGFDEGIDGFELGQRMSRGAKRFGAESKLSQVLSVDLKANPKLIRTDSGDFQARAVVLATGAEPRKLGLPNEELLTGQGVHYCAACDGMFYRGKTVVLVGGGNSAVADALVLSRIAKKVILVHRRDSLRAEKIYHDALQKAENVEIRWNSEVRNFLYADRVNGVVLHNNQTGLEEKLFCDGVFVSVGRTPATELFVGQLDLDAHGYIVADESTASSLPGVYAVGDVRTKAVRQIVTATADGAVAAHHIEEYLASNVA
jgi:thioredoxin reductase (NADPH)